MLGEYVCQRKPFTVNFILGLQQCFVGCYKPLLPVLRIYCLLNSCAHFCRICTGICSVLVALAIMYHDVSKGNMGRNHVKIQGNVQVFHSTWRVVILFVPESNEVCGNTETCVTLDACGMEV